MRDEYSIRRALLLVALVIYLGALVAALAVTVVADAGSQPRTCVVCGDPVDRPVGRYCSASCQRAEDPSDG